MVDQAYTPVSLPNNEQDIKKQLKTFFEDTDIGFNHLGEQEKNLNMMIHGPSSRFHIIRAEDDPENAVIPKVEVEGSDYLLDYAANSHNFHRKTVEFLEYQSQVKNANGEFKPIPFRFNDKEEISLNPYLFLAAYLGKVSAEAEQTGFKGKVQIVMHPDIVFFAAGSLEPQAIQKAAGNITKLTKEFPNIKIYYENVYLGHPYFKKHLGWATNPFNIIEKFGIDNLSGGLCVDIKHLIDMGYSQGETIVVIKQLIAQGIDVLIHVKKDGMTVMKDTEYSDLITELYKLPGVSGIAYEPRGV